MDADLIQATQGDLPFVRNLVRFYVYDLSESMGWDCSKEGLFDGVPDLPLYWGLKSEHPRYDWPPGWKGSPYLIRAGTALAGFALVKILKGEKDSLHDMGEFFVLRKFRGKGIGRQVAHAAFDRHPGRWQTRQMCANKPAQGFWRKVIARYRNGEYQETIEADPLWGDEVIQRFYNG